MPVYSLGLRIALLFPRAQLPVQVFQGIYFAGKALTAIAFSSISAMFSQLPCTGVW